MKSFFLSFLLLLGSVVLCCSSSLIEPNETLNKGFLSNITQHLKHFENSTSRCNKSETYIGCSYNSGYITYDFGQRSVAWQIPVGTPPAKGWPVVLFFQGSFFRADLAFWSYAGEPFGAYNQVEVVMNLLDNGFAVIAPFADFNGYTFWNTNIPPFDVDWEIAPDHHLMLQIFQLIQASEFGKLDFSKMYATGISSGGYMTSRMAISYTSYFRSLVIESGSYCVCSGVLCYVPDDLPQNHPPTLFLHGELDPIVPIFTMWMYYDKLNAINITVQAVVSTFADHQWIDEAPDQVYKWFLKYP